MTQRLATIANKLQRDTDFDYVVIGDRQLYFAFYHPNPEKIGYPMQFTKQGALEKGESYFITGKGSMGMAMRATKCQSLMTMEKSSAWCRLATW